MPNLMQEMASAGSVSFKMPPVRTGKTIYTLNLNYPKEITDLTYPLMERYAQKIGATIQIVSERAYPEMPLTYEKFQARDLALLNCDSWSFFIDSDALIHPDTPDVTELIRKDTVLFNGRDFAPNRWTYDRYFRRDGRHIGACTWFVAWSDWCSDLWHPLDDISIDEAVSRIHPIQNELSPYEYERDKEGNPIQDKDGALLTRRKQVVTPEHLIDDYILSRNIARFGLKHKTFLELQSEFGDKAWYLAHQYTLTTDQKVEWMKGVLKSWMLL